MPILSLPSPDALKAQAKRLRASAAARGASLSHSHCLEALASVYGYKDWNTLLASASDARKLYIAYCSFDAVEEGERGHGFFDFYVQAPSPEDVEAICKKELASVRLKSKETEAFSTATNIYIDEIVEVNAVPAHGAIVNYRSSRGDFAMIRHMMPCGDPSPDIEFYTTDDPDRDGDDPVEPLLTLEETVRS